MKNVYIDSEWIVRETMRTFREAASDARFVSGDPWPAEVREARAAAPRPVLAVAPLVPPSLLVAGLVAVVAAKVPFSRRRLLFPWLVRGA